MERISNNFFHIIMLCLAFIGFCVANRSAFRKPDPSMPKIITFWPETPEETYTVRDSHFEAHALTKFDKGHFEKHALPCGRIRFRNNKKKSVSGKKLKKLAEKLMCELKQKKRQYKDFIVLKKADFNYQTISGTLVLKYKKYPFVLKLFIETPRSFSSPFTKGWQPSCFFVMSGGINRYLSGFTRIKNLKAIRKLVAKNPEYASIISTPRKWFWTPKSGRWFTLTTRNIGPRDQSILLPSVYGIIADAIDAEKTFSILNKQHRQFAMKLSNYLGNRLDPNIDNFMVEKRTKKIVIVDTEHFPTMVGLHERTEFTSYTQWYITLAGKCAKNKFLRSKKMRREIQKHPLTPLEI